MTKRATFNTYFDFDPDSIQRMADEFRPVMAKRKIDTIVVRGTSGTLVGSALRMLIPDLNVFVIRKPNEKSHNGERPIGTMGERWVFFDDFVDTGATFKACYDGVSDAHSNNNYSFMSGTYRSSSRKVWTPKFVGIWEYKSATFSDKRSINAKGKRAQETGWGWRCLPEW